ncbi:MAG: choice-of-anchor tandem repeat GloVer-containing protein [Candidatus Sulfotelmatobacter sp.]
MSKRKFVHRTAPGVFILWLAMAGVSAASDTFTSLASFDKTNGNEPNHTALIQATDGNLYGVTSYGGVNGSGAVFRVSTTGTLDAIYSFCSLANCADGENPYTSLIQASNGDLYGTTSAGGASKNGTLFKITTSGTLTTLYSFCSLAKCADGSEPEGQLAVDTAGNIYGVANEGGASNFGTVFKFSTKGVLTTLHSFSGADGEYPEGGLVAASGVFYGTAEYGGANGDGTIFKITTAGTETTLHSFTGSDGLNPKGWLVDVAGTFYGTTQYGGANNEGSVFKMTSAGAVTTLYSFCSLASCADGSAVTAGLMQATDGNLYGVTDIGGANNDGTVYELTLKGVLTTLHSFDNTDGYGPQGTVLQDTNGDFYGFTEFGGSIGDGTVFRIATGLKAFVTLESTSGTHGSKVGILGDGFSSSSVVKFNGVTATTVTLSEAGLLTATVPAGATDGYVTVTTESTTLTSTQKYTVHNSWSTGAAIPVPVICPAVGFIGGKIYVVGGGNGSVAVGDNQVYNTANNTWSTAAAMPTPVGCAAYAVVAGTLYVIGGSQGTTFNDTVQAYNPAKNSWSTKTPMPIARGSIPAAVVDGTSIYVMGGNGTTLRLDNLEKYDTKTDTWTEESPLLVGRSETTGGLLGSTLVTADGDTNSGTTGDAEAYDLSTNTWSELTADPTPRGGPCFGAISGQLYLAGGSQGAEAINVTELFNHTADKWTTLPSMPNAVMWSGSTVANGQLYCFGGTPTTSGTTADNYVQVYQP